MHPFRAAIEARDVDAAAALMADDVEFRSPVVFKPYRGRDAVHMLLSAIAQVLEDFEYTHEIGGENDREHALVFKARAGDKQVEGCDFLYSNGDGKVEEFVVMIRPMSGIHAVADAMAKQLEAAQSG